MHAIGEKNTTDSAQSLLIQLGVKECLLQSDEKKKDAGDDQKKDMDLAKLAQILERCNIVHTVRKAGLFPPSVRFCGMA